MELLVITSHITEAIPPGLAPSLVNALVQLGRRARALTSLPSAAHEETDFGVVAAPLDALLSHRDWPVSRCFFVVPADPLALQALPQIEARVRAARAGGVDFRVHHWILTDEDDSGLVDLFERCCAPVRADWVVAPRTDGRAWAQSVVELLLGAAASPPTAPARPTSAASERGASTPTARRPHTDPRSTLGPGQTQGDPSDQTELGTAGRRRIATRALAVAAGMMGLVVLVTVFVTFARRWLS